MKKNYINSILASALLLASCGGNGSQNQATQQAPDSSKTEVPAAQEQVSEAPSEKPCNFDFAKVMLYDGMNPISCDSGYVSDETYKSFSKILVKGKFYDIAFNNYQNGDNMSGNLLWGDSYYYDDLTGFTYKFTGEKPKKLEYSELFFVFTKEFADAHEPLGIKYSDSPKLSQGVKDYVAKRYPKYKLNKTWGEGNIGNGTAMIYSMSFKPVADSILAINVLEHDGKYFVDEVWGHGGGWNVDDEGEYHFPYIEALKSKDGNHIELLYDIGAAESTTFGRLVIDGESLKREKQYSYYNYIDYSSRKIPSIWDIEDFWEKIKAELPNLQKPESFATFQIADEKRKINNVFLKCGDTIINCRKFDRDLIFLYKNTMDKVTLYQNAIKNCHTFFDSYSNKTINCTELWFTDVTNKKYDDGQEISYGVDDGEYDAASDEVQFAEAEKRLSKEIDKKSLKWTKIKF